MKVSKIIGNQVTFDDEATAEVSAREQQFITIHNLAQNVIADSGSLTQAQKVDLIIVQNDLQLQLVKRMFRWVMNKL